MKETGITVNFEWAYKKVVSSHDFTGKTPAWINSYVEGWREGFLVGYLQGRTEMAIEILCRMKLAGFSTDKIAECTGYSLRVVEMMFGEGAPLAE